MQLRFCHVQKFRWLTCPQHAGPFFIFTGEEFDFELAVKFLTSYASKFT